MTFVLPKMLFALAIAPGLVIGYVMLQRRRAQRTAVLAVQGLVPLRRLGRRRHVPFALFLLALAGLLAALARPQIDIGIPRREGTVMLAFDVSNSMAADDLKPTRMAAAKAAARLFVDKQPSTIKVGIVAFSEGGFVTQQPTDVRADVLAAIDRLTPQGGTSLGQGIFTALTAIAGKPIVAEPGALDGNIEDVNIGFFGSAAIVLLSDGENNSRPDPLQVAELASVAGVRIFSIGIGSAEGAVVTIDGFSAATTLDEELLTQIADATDGTYYRAENEKDLAEVYDSIDLQFTRKAETTEVTAVFTGAATLLLVVGGLLSLLWFGRVV